MEEEEPLDILPLHLRCVRRLAPKERDPSVYLFSGCVRSAACWKGVFQEVVREQVF